MWIATTIAIATYPSHLASADEWTGVLAGGFEATAGPDLTGRGWGLFEAYGRGVAGNANLRLHYNTTKLHIGVERLSFANDKLAFFAFAEGEAILSQILRDYFQRGVRLRERGFNASYALLHTRLQWYPGDHQTLEVVLAARHWWFGADGKTSPDLVLPPNTWVFEPRIGYVYWNVDVPSREWEAHRFFPRIRGIALGVSAGVDVRSSFATWGLDDPRNQPGRAIYTIRQWFRSGWQVASFVRLQLDQWGSYGWGEDDITRNRVGGLNPYVIPVPGLPWTGLISERLFAAQLAAHFRPKESAPHELGVLLGGGAFNDVTRTGALGTYGGAGGVALVGDLRFGERDRWQLNARVSYGFPVVWLTRAPYVAGLISAGVRVF